MHICTLHNILSLHTGCLLPSCYSPLAWSPTRQEWAGDIVPMPHENEGVHPWMQSPASSSGHLWCSHLHGRNRSLTLHPWFVCGYSAQHLCLHHLWCRHLHGRKEWVGDALPMVHLWVQSPVCASGGNRQVMHVIIF